MVAIPVSITGYFNRRRVEFNEVPPPMRVSARALALCRERVESQRKMKLRSLLLPAIRHLTGAWEIGEGFQWGENIGIAGARIGAYVYVGPYTYIDGPVSVGDLTMLSRNITLISNDHEHRNAELPMRVAFRTEGRPVTIIESDCWIGCGVILREGVHIARGTVVAAGAVVIKNTEPYSIVGGAPARWLGSRFSWNGIRTYETILYD
jgi:acetyltransferase-like isoleucine patch superfamily enzyme